MTTDQHLYEQWREDYALAYEPNYDEHLEADCRAAFFAGIRAAIGAKVVPDAYLAYAKGSTRYWVVTLNPDDVPEIYKGGETVPLYRSANAPNQPQAEQCQSCRTGSPYACTCPFKTHRNSDPSCFAAAPVQLPEPAVPYAVFDCHGFYETMVTKAAAQSFCDHYNKRDADAGGSAPYTVQALYTEHQVMQLLKRN